MIVPNQQSKVTIVKSIDTSSLPWCNEAVLVSVEGGSGALREVGQRIPEDEYGNDISSALTLNGVPLAQARRPECPTCAGMLATGYGIENAGCAELTELSERINSDYVDLPSFIETITPLLLLLKSGLYLIADTRMYPTDGDGHFFWDVPNPLTKNPATWYAYNEDGYGMAGFPAYLYPSQSSGRFDEARMRHYMERLSRSENGPRAISYHLDNFISVLLDGHHKATAAVMLGKRVRCVDILPLTGYRYKPGGLMEPIDDILFSGVSVPAEDIPTYCLKYLYNNPESRIISPKLNYRETNLASKPWGPEYEKAARRYPTVNELADMVSAHVETVTDELIRECLSDLHGDNLLKLRAIVSILSMDGDERVKALAMKCGRVGDDLELRIVAFKALSLWMDDPEVERYFIEYIVSHNEPYDVLKRMAERYIEGQEITGPEQV